MSHDNITEQRRKSTLSVERKVQVLDITVGAKYFTNVCLVNVACELFYYNLRNNQYSSTAG